MSHFITGCNLRLPLDSEQPFRLEPKGLLRCQTQGLSKADSHSSAVTSCAQCKLNQSPGSPSYIEAGPPWDYGDPSPPQDQEPFLPPAVQEEGTVFDPAEWGAVDVDEEGGTEPPRKPREESKAPVPTPAQAAVELPVFPKEERRPKETVIAKTEVLAITPPQTPASKPPLYNPSNAVPQTSDTKVSTLLAYAGAEGGPSVLGWSKLKSARLCLRSFFYRWIAGLVPKDNPDSAIAIAETEVAQDQRRGTTAALSPLDLGSVFHATLELHRRTGGIATWDALYALRTAHPTLALEVKRYVDAYLAKWGPIEAKEWDVRGTEREGRYFYPSRRCAGKNRRLCVSSRYDVLYHALRQGEARGPIGRPVSSICINEMKTTRAMGREGYRVDGQILLQAGTYKWGSPITPEGTIIVDKTNEEVYGPLRGVTVDWIVKAAASTFDPAKHLKRQSYMVSDEQIRHFLTSLGDWLYEELGARIFHAKADEAETWPQSWLCHGMFYPTWVCPYHYLCDMAVAHRGWEWYYQALEDTLDLDALALPKKRAKPRKKRGRAVAPVEGK